MKRAHAINAMKFAGYHGDKSAFTGLLIGSRVSYPVALDAYREGERARASGIRCACHECDDAAGPVVRALMDAVGVSR